jgi:LIVCS family branched-chain amino acid:cation transporter
MNIFTDYIEHKLSFKWTVISTLLISLPLGLSELGLLTDQITLIMSSLPLYELGLPWLLPAIFGFSLSSIYYELKKRTKKKKIQPMY